MNAKRVLGFVFFVIVSMSLATASAQLSVVEEHVFEFTDNATPWEMSVMVPYYDPDVHGGAPLEEIVVILEGSAKSDVDVVANGGDVVVIEGEVGAFITASGFVSGLTIDVLPMGQFAPPVINVPANTMLNLTEITGEDMDMLVMSGQQNVGDFEGTGAYELSVNSLATSSLSTSGGNMDASQRTISQSHMTIQYKAIAVPEPASAVFLVLGMIGLAWLRRR